MNQIRNTDCDSVVVHLSSYWRLHRRSFQPVYIIYFRKLVYVPELELLLPDRQLLVVSAPWAGGPDPAHVGTRVLGPDYGELEALDDVEPGGGPVRVHGYRPVHTVRHLLQKTSKWDLKIDYKVPKLLYISSLKL